MEELKDIKYTVDDAVLLFSEDGLHTYLPESPHDPDNPTPAHILLAYAVVHLALTDKDWVSDTFERYTDALAKINKESN